MTSLTTVSRFDTTCPGLKLKFAHFNYDRYCYWLLRVRDVVPKAIHSLRREQQSSNKPEQPGRTQPYRPGRARLPAPPHTPPWGSSSVRQSLSQSCKFTARRSAHTLASTRPCLRLLQSHRHTIRATCRPSPCTSEANGARQTRIRVVCRVVPGNASR